MPSAEPTGIAMLSTEYTRRSEEHTSELQSRLHLVCRLLLEKKKTRTFHLPHATPSTKFLKHPRRYNSMTPNQASEPFLHTGALLHSHVMFAISLHSSIHAQL